MSWMKIQVYRIPQPVNAEGLAWSDNLIIFKGITNRQSFPTLEFQQKAAYILPQTAHGASNHQKP
jgi:hypothetical protein